MLGVTTLERIRGWELFVRKTVSFYVRLFAVAILGAHSALTGDARASGNNAGLQIPAGADIKISFDYGEKYPDQRVKSWGGGGPSHHKGIDFMRRKSRTPGSPVISSTYGVVEGVRHQECAAGEVLVKSTVKQFARTVSIVYSHLGDIYVKAGDTLEPGVAIGTINTDRTNKYPCMGRVPHLHFGTLKPHLHGRFKDPFNPRLVFKRQPEGKTCFKYGEEYLPKKDVMILPFPCDNRHKIILTYKKRQDAEIAYLTERYRIYAPSHVKLFQSAAKKQGVYTGRIDGIYGPRTRKALERCLRTLVCKLP